MRILVIDPGSTSTKIGIYEHDEYTHRANISHDRDLINNFAMIIDQMEMRYEVIYTFLERHGYLSKKFNAISARGGMIKPVTGGTYIINDALLRDLSCDENCRHASNLGGILAHRFSQFFKCDAYIVDPVVIDEMDPVAKISGFRGISRKSQFHTLNQKKAAKIIAKRLKKRYTDVNLVVAHLGGGISVAAHRKGKVVDVNNALDGDGPMSPERAGSLPICGVIDLIKSGEYKPDEIPVVISRKGGLYSYLGVTDFLDVEKMIKEGNKEAKLIAEAMAYQIAKEIGSLAAALQGKLDGVILTGGLAHSDFFTGMISSYIRFLGEIFILPGEFELEALAEGVKHVLTGEEAVKHYT